VRRLSISSRRGGTGCIRNARINSKRQTAKSQKNPKGQTAELQNRGKQRMLVWSFQSRFGLRPDLGQSKTWPYVSAPPRVSRTTGAEVCDLFGVWPFGVWDFNPGSVCDRTWASRRHGPTCRLRRAFRAEPVLRFVICLEFGRLAFGISTRVRSATGPGPVEDMALRAIGAGGVAGRARDRHRDRMSVVLRSCTVQRLDLRLHAPFRSEEHTSELQ